jgi:hypothetical protein
MDLQKLVFLIRIIGKGNRLIDIFVFFFQRAAAVSQTVHCSTYVHTAGCTSGRTPISAAVQVQLQIWIIPGLVKNQDPG